MFPAPTGKTINDHTFRRRAWKKILASLGIELPAQSIDGYLIAWKETIHRFFASSVTFLRSMGMLSL
jgi:hypothetical protein